MYWSGIVSFLLTLISTCAAYAQVVAQRTAIERTIAQELETVRQGYNIPAISVRVWQNNNRLISLTQGVRAEGAAEAASENDLWHIGSCGKVMTAVMILRLVDRGTLTLDAPIHTQLPADLLPFIHAGLRGATLLQLLSHTSGITDENLRDGIKGHAAKRFSRLTNVAERQRWQAVSIALERKPEYLSGDVFQYSNLGYIVAGLIASHATGKSWSQLMREEVFAPLGMKSAGFSAPGNASRIDQPRGHEMTWKWLVIPQIKVKVPGTVEADFPAFYGPAGLIHLSMDDWATFCRMLLNGQQNRSDFLRPISFARLFTPVKSKTHANYGLGLQVERLVNGVPTLLTHTGSNGYWRANFRLDPTRNQIILMAANLGSDDVDKAFETIAKTIERAAQSHAAPSLR